MTKHRPAMIIKKIWWIFLPLMLFFISVPEIYANGDLRCGTRIVSLGERKFDVITKCGEPTYRSVRYEKRVKRDLFRDLFPPRELRESEKYREPFFVEEFVEVDEWAYNFGSLQFVRYLTFENGILVNIEIGDYGY